MTPFICLKYCNGNSRPML